MSENIAPASVDGITLAEVTELLRAWNAMEAGSTKALPLAAPSIARAYLALSERVGELEGAANALMRELPWVNDQLDLMPDDFAEAQTRLSAALSHKGMDHG